MVGNKAICYQGILRVFRNAVVGFLRTQLPSAMPNDHIQQMQRLFRDPPYWSVLWPHQNLI